MKKTMLVLMSLLYILPALGCVTSGDGKNSSSVLTVEALEEGKNEQDSVIPHTSSIGLIVYQTPAKYTYDNLTHDLAKLQSVYGETLLIRSLCDTADDRKVYDVVLGNPDEENQILIFGAIHAREYITTQVVMRQLCAAIDAVNGYGDAYRGIPLGELMDAVTIHFIPMSNPDGVVISQQGLGAIHSTELRERIMAMGEADYEQWKANGTGVDLNRNFDAGWIEYEGSVHPSSEYYKGRFPGSEPESAALIFLTKNNHVRRTINYHTCGALIYWYYKQDGDVLEKSRVFAQRMSQETGYPLESDYASVDAAGYKDWAIYRREIPSLTIEVGAENSRSVNPVPIDRWDAIWERNKNVLYATIYDLKNE